MPPSPSTRSSRYLPRWLPGASATRTRLRARVGGLVERRRCSRGLRPPRPPHDMPTSANVIGSAIIAIAATTSSSSAPSTYGDHRSPNRWIAKIIAAIALARSSGGTARRPIALTGDVDRNSPSSARNARAKNADGVGIRNATAVERRRPHHADRADPQQRVGAALVRPDHRTASRHHRMVTLRAVGPATADERADRRRRRRRRARSSSSRSRSVTVELARRTARR